MVDSTTLYYFFSSTAQVFAALIAIVITVLVYFINIYNGLVLEIIMIMRSRLSLNETERNQFNQLDDPNSQVEFLNQLSLTKPLNVQQREKNINDYDLVKQKLRLKQNIFNRLRNLCFWTLALILLSLVFIVFTKLICENQFLLMVALTISLILIAINLIKYFLLIKDISQK